MIVLVLSLHDVSKIATLSPADICYEESLSTLRYAERYNHTRSQQTLPLPVQPR